MYRTAAEGGELNAWTERQRSEESSMRGQNSSGGRGVSNFDIAAAAVGDLCVNRTAAEGGKFYVCTEQQQRERIAEKGGQSRS